MLSASIAMLGAMIAAYRVSSLLRKQNIDQACKSKMPAKVSLIIPARNEEANIARLLDSLNRIDYGSLEVIVVDDQSSDLTAQIAARYGVRVISGVPRPEGWCGKQWACQQGADAASGDVLVFTDADTIHHPDSVCKALAFMRHNNLDMLSVAPKHLGRSLWETSTGYFQVLLMFAANAFGRQVPGRTYCIGQYIMFSRAAYARIGGHASVKSAIVEDVPLANRALALGMRYNILNSQELYSVRMYENLNGFVAGWRRNFRAGLKESSPLATLEVTAIIGALLAGGTTAPGPIEIAGFLICLSAMFLLVRRFTNYGVLSIAGIPVSIALFCLITSLAVFDALLRKDVIWKGRAIPVQ